MLKPTPVVGSEGGIGIIHQGRRASVNSSISLKNKKPQKETTFLLDTVGSIHHVSSASSTGQQSR